MSDLRDAWRSLRATPVVSVLAVLSLALGIGANTAVFSILDSLLLRSLPVRDPQRLVLLTIGDEGNWSWTNPQWEQIRERRDLFNGAFAYSTTRFNLASGGETQPVDGIQASGAFFDVLGVNPVLGRLLRVSDDKRGGGDAGAVAVLSYGFWQRRYGGAPSVLGQTLTLDGVPFTVVGVTPASFSGLEVGTAFDVVVPLGTEPLLRGAESELDRRSSWWLSLMARLKPGQTLEDANRAFRATQPAVRAATMPTDWPANELDSYLKERFRVAFGATGDSSLRERYQKPLAALMVIVGLVLLIACANIANLLLARATARRHEVSVRLALGAPRWRIARQYLVESLLLAAMGTLFGTLLARWGAALLVRAISTQRMHVSLDLSTDWRVLAFTIAATVTTALLFGTVPALRSMRVQAGEALKEEGRGVAGERRFAPSGVMLVAQVALSLVLIVAAGLFVRTFTSLASRSLGFDRERMVVARLDGERCAPDAKDLQPLFEQVRAAVSTLPGVTLAATSVVTPVGNSTWMWAVQVNDETPTGEQLKSVYVNFVSPKWFATYQTPILSGRDFDDRDRAGAPEVVMVNQAFVRRFIGNRQPLGMRISQTRAQNPPPPAEIVGVVADAVYRNLRDAVPPTIYFPLAQIDRVPTAVSLTFRAAGAASASLNREVSKAAVRVNPRFALTFRSLSRQVDDSITQERLVAMLSAFFGLLALLLAGLGLYGIASYSVTRRRTELGIRLALGASPSRLTGTVLGRIGVLVAIGLALGTGLSLWAATLARTLLFGLEPRDPLTLTGAALALASVSLLAGLVPARRATTVDPAVVLRDV